MTCQICQEEAWKKYMREQEKSKEDATNNTKIKLDSIVKLSDMVTVDGQEIEVFKYADPDGSYKSKIDADGMYCKKCYIKSLNFKPLFSVHIPRDFSSMDQLLNDFHDSKI